MDLSIISYVHILRVKNTPYGATDKRVSNDTARGDGTKHSIRQETHTEVFGSI